MAQIVADFLATGVLASFVTNIMQQRPKLILPIKSCAVFQKKTWSQSKQKCDLALPYKKAIWVSKRNRNSHFANRSAVVVLVRLESAFPMQKLQKYLSRLWPLLHPSSFSSAQLGKSRNLKPKEKMSSNNCTNICHVYGLCFTHPPNLPQRNLEKKPNLTPNQNIANSCIHDFSIIQ